MITSTVDELRVSLEREAEELAEHRDELRSELAEVERQLEARRNAVEHLALIRPLTPAPVAPAGDVPTEEATADTPVVAGPTTPRKRRPKTAPKKGDPARAHPAHTAPATAPAKKTRAKKTPTAKPTPEPATGRPVRTHLRDELAEILEKTGEPMNVRQLTEALGETTTKSRMESVRTSTEGLVKAGRALKTGRGLFAGTTT
ncbi:hypothetical protein [Embleya sp. NPDC020886]|uniref:hypothetical protein n=1 Tax=Embleya sp. NPDC020886 TaxID=3363980 RepID=UPI0037A9B59B